MNAARIALALALGATALVGGVASAAPVGVCNIVKDAEGDGYPTTAAPAGPNEAALDIKSFDFGSDAKQLTAVFRMAQAAKSATTAPTGIHVFVTFMAPGYDNPLFVQYSNTTTGGEQFDFGWDDPINGLTSLGTGKGVVDTAKNEIRVTAPLSGFTSQTSIKSGAKLTDVLVYTSRDLVVLLPYADNTAGAPGTHTVGSKTCVTPGA